MGLQRQNVCLQSKLLTWYLIYMILLLLYSIPAFKAYWKWTNVVERGYFQIQEKAIF